MQQKLAGKSPAREALRQKRTKRANAKQNKARVFTLSNELDIHPFEMDSLPLLSKSKGSRHIYPIRHIVIHTTGTLPGKPMVDLDKLPYHLVLTKSGRVISIKPLQLGCTCIEIALIGGMDKEGNHCDTRTKEQSEVLFETLVMLTELCPAANIVAADEIYVYNHVNPGFDIKKWLQEYIPEFLQNAA